MSRLAKDWICGVYAITPDQNEYWSEMAVLECAFAALAGGVRLIQLRQKNLDWPVVLAMATRLGAECEKLGAGLILNDAPVDAMIAHNIPGLIGVHLGKHDIPVAQAKVLFDQLRLGGDKVSYGELDPVQPALLVGASCYNKVHLAVKAVADGADYCAFGAMYPSATKPLAVRACMALLGTPVHVPKVAIGGIEFSKLPELARAGANAVAVVGGVFGTSGQIPDAERVMRNARQWVEQWAALSAAVPEIER